jgi:hypothetical protein
MCADGLPEKLQMLRLAAKCHVGPRLASRLRLIPIGETPGLLKKGATCAKRGQEAEGADRVMNSGVVLVAD